jgi:hypothetical protein
VYASLTSVMVDPKSHGGAARTGPLFARIAGLHRELAEAYEQLAEGATPTKQKRARGRCVAPLEVVPSQEAIDEMRRTLRRKGFTT